MKKYEAMEALKVTFNAREQVAAACPMYLQAGGGKYTNDYDKDYCNWEFDGTTWTQKAGGKTFANGISFTVGNYFVDLTLRYAN